MKSAYNEKMSGAEVRSFLLRHLTREAADFWGETDSTYLARVADDWLDTTGKSGSAWRIEKIRSLFPDAERILDMGAGCGTFVHYALRQGYEAYGIEPEPWKRAVALMQCCAPDMKAEWASRVLSAVGERLPFADDSFDCIATFQTLEHVQDLHVCCSEMLRVVRPGGGIHVRCPDYSLSTYEGHYRLPWLPWLRGPMAERYLRLCGKPVKGLRSLQFVSARMLAEIFTAAAKEAGIKVRVINVDYQRVLRMFHLRDGVLARLLTRPAFFIHYLRFLFRADYAVHLAVHVDGK